MEASGEVGNLLPKKSADPGNHRRPAPERGRTVSRKYQQFLDAHKRDQEICQNPNCRHPRGWHVGDKNCTASTTEHCTCERFVGKEGGAK